MIRYEIRKENGFTLVEMAVALVLSSLILIALTGTFILQNKAYTATRMSTELQNNARTALDTISLMVSNAGFGITQSIKTTPIPPNTIPLSAAFYLPNYSIVGSLGYNAGKDNYKNSTMDGTECVNHATSADKGGPCPPYGTDSLTFAYREPNYLADIIALNTGTNPPTIQYDATYPAIQLQPGDVLFLIDPNHVMSALVTITGTTGTIYNPGQQVQLSTTNSFYNEWNPVIINNGAAFVGTTPTQPGFVQKVDIVHVYVDYTVPEHPALMMQINGNTALPLADNIEDFQVQFVMDSGEIMGAPASGNPVQTPAFPSMNKIYYSATSTATATTLHENPTNINAVIITLVARSDIPNPNLTSVAAPLTLLADHNITTTPYPLSTLGNLANYQTQIYQRIIQIPNVRTASKLFDNRAL